MMKSDFCKDEGIMQSCIVSKKLEPFGLFQIRFLIDFVVSKEIGTVFVSIVLSLSFLIDFVSRKVRMMRPDFFGD
jgi:hypothetical protein